MPQIPTFQLDVLAARAGNWCRREWTPSVSFQSAFSLHSLHYCRKLAHMFTCVRACLRVCVFFFDLNLSTSCYCIPIQHRSFNFLQSIITTWRKCELVGSEVEFMSSAREIAKKVSRLGNMEDQCRRFISLPVIS